MATKKSAKAATKKSEADVNSKTAKGAQAPEGTDASRQSELTGRGAEANTGRVADPSPYAQEGGLGNPDLNRGPA